MAEEKLIVQLRGFDAKHYRTTEKYAKQVERLYDTAVQEMATAASGVALGEDETFTFDRYPKAKKQAQGIVTRLAQRIEAVTTQGVKAEWEAACHKNDAFVGSIIRTSQLTKEEAEQYNSRNLEALNTFQQRKVGGLNLSQRVWKYVGDFRDAMELGIDIGLGEGRSAAELSRDLRQYLREPDRLYRRVRDKGGNLRLSKAAKMYHSGQGVYRSSYKNAMRLARTEINMAYREAEYQRWQQLDFVVGFRIHLSNNHTILNSKGEPVPFHDICDELAGDYPKTFKFVGWHPQCRCFVTPILSDYDEYNKNRANRLKAIVRKQQYKALPSRRTVTDVPPTFRKYIEGIEERAKGWKSQPYYIRDNFKGGVIGGGLNGRIPTKTMNTVQPCTEFDGLISSLKRWAYALGLNVSGLDALRNAGDRNALKLEVDRINAIATQRQDEWIDASSELQATLTKIKEEGFYELEDEYRNTLKENFCDSSKYYADCIVRLKQAVAKALAELKAAITKREETRAKGGDTPHRAMKTTYNDRSEVRDTVKAINGGLTEAWFRHGVGRLEVETNKNNNGSTVKATGDIWLRKERLEKVMSAFAKIGQGRSADITEQEADAMATYWHEITHNRNKTSTNAGSQASKSRRYMELANEFVARKTLPEFYSTLGCAKTPHPQFIDNRASTGYNAMVNNYDGVIKTLKLDAGKTLGAVRTYLFNEDYATQKTGLVEGLKAGGIRKLDGTKPTTAEIGKLVSLCSTGRSWAYVENWLRINGYIK